MRVSTVGALLLAILSISVILGPVGVLNVSSKRDYDNGAGYQLEPTEDSIIQPKITIGKLPAQSQAISVPYHSQSKSYYCGEASLEMAFDYWGPGISQYEIANAARVESGPGTYTSELRRAAQFSNMSTSQGNDAPGYGCTGYTGRDLGYGAFECWFNSSTCLSQLESLVDQGYPIPVLTWYSSSHPYGHYRIVIGYNATGVIAHDPWDGASRYYSNSLFLDLWNYSTYWGLFTSPWLVSINAPNSVGPNSTFQLNATITYLCPSPFDPLSEQYPADTCRATIQLPSGFSLAPGENLTKLLSPTSLHSKESRTVSWQIVAGATFGYFSVSVLAEGLVHGSVPGHGSYPSYSYNDRIGGADDTIIEISGGQHDIALTNVKAPKSVDGQSYPIFMNVSVTNQGDYVETFNITVYANTTCVASQNVTLLKGNSTTINFIWNTTGFAYGNYTTSAYAWPVPGETDTSDNLLFGGSVTISIPGDITADFIVDIYDAILLSSAYNSEPGNSNWKANADINSDNIVDLYDAIILSSNFNQQLPQKHTQTLP